jgi:hypothetical protein
MANGEWRMANGEWRLDRGCHTLRGYVAALERGDFPPGVELDQGF